MRPIEILVVEDDAALCVGLRDVLELAGYKVTTAANGMEGLAALERSTPALIISDIMMPHMDGYQLYVAVRARPQWVGIPFIFLTAKSTKTDIRQGKQLGADDYLTKPFDAEDLLVAVRAKLQRRAELEAERDRQIEELKHSILTTLNHEFRTPLTYITSYSELLQLAGPNMTADELKNFMRGIKVGSDRLRRLVEDFIALVELQTGEAQTLYERRRKIITELPALLVQIAEKYAQQAALRQIKLITDIPDVLPPIEGDAEYLQSAVSRLVDNALKFSKKSGGEVTLAARAAEGNIIIEVKDTGIGIRAEDQARLFDTFHQIDRAKMEQQGSGSGLAIARGIVLLHKGTLTAASELGVGSTFTITLPVAGG